MSTNIKCPNCGSEFPLETVLNEELKETIEKEKQELRQQMTIHLKKKEEEHLRKENEWKTQQEKREKELQQQLEINLRKNISSDFENQLRQLEQNNKDAEEKLKLSRQKEADFLRKEQELKNKEAEIDITVQKQLQRDREKLSEDIRKIEEQKVAAKENEFLLKIKELEKQRDDQKKLADEMRRKAEQGSMQLQGEVQELALEEMLRITFPFDIISEVGKGVRGADSIQIVRNSLGQECGKIIFESKRTENFSVDWIEKLKSDMHNQGADIAVIVTKTMPKEMSQFGERQGVYICTFFEAKSLVNVLRNAILKIAEAKKIQENKGDKMNAIYDYVTGTEFRRSLQMMRENFRNLQHQMDKEKEDFEKNWQKKRKMIQSIIDNSSHISGSIEGISGTDVDLNLLEDSTEEE